MAHQPNASHDDAVPSAAPPTFDAVVIGGGPAGLTAAFYLARFRRSVLCVSGGTSRTASIPMSFNHPAVPSIPGKHLLAKTAAQAVACGAAIVRGSVTRLELGGPGGAGPDVFTLGVRLEDEADAAKLVPDDGDGDGGDGARAPPRPMRHVHRVRARAVILATGVADHEPSLPGLPPRPIASGLVRVSPMSDGFEVSGAKVGVVGAGPIAARTAVSIRQFTPHVTLLTDGARLAAAGRDADADAAARASASASGDVDEYADTTDALPAAAVDVTLGVPALSGAREELDAFGVRVLTERVTGVTPGGGGGRGGRGGHDAADAAAADEAADSDSHAPAPLAGGPLSDLLRSSTAAGAAGASQYASHQEPVPPPPPMSTQAAGAADACAGPWGAAGAAHGFVVSFAAGSGGDDDRAGERVPPHDEHFDALYSGLGSTPRSALAAAVGAALTPSLHVKVDEGGMTNVPGLAAAGDVTESLAQMGVAMGEGAVAAAAINAFLGLLLA